MDTHAEELICKVMDDCASPAEKDTLQHMATTDPDIAEALAEQQEAVNAIRSIGLRELTDDVRDAFLGGVYNQLERRTAWILISTGLACVIGYTLYELLTQPTIDTVYRIGLAAVLVGFGLLLSSVLRTRMRIKPYDRYKEVVR